MEFSQPQSFNPLAHAVEITIVESVNCTLTRDGDFQSCEVLGELVLKCLDPKKLKVTI